MKTLWPFLFYVSFYAAASALMPFAAVYYQSLGFSGGQIGLLTGLAPLVTLVGAPFWTGLADATHRHRWVLTGTLLGAASLALLVPSLHSFAALLPVILLFSLVGSPVISLGDSATMATLGERRQLYGRVRIGGSIGWGIMGYIAGLVIEHNGLAWAFWIYAAGMTLTMLISQGLIFDRVESQGSYSKGIRTLLADRRWLLFLGMAFIAGVGTSSFHIYQFLFMQEVGASKTLMGLSLTISTLAEMPVMFFANRLLKRWHPMGLFMVGMAVTGLKGLLYFVFDFPAAILLIQLLHGFTFPAIWIAGVSFANENAPAGLKATGQGLFAAMMSGFGPAVSGLLGGLLIGALGSGRMYLVIGSTVLVSLSFFIVLRYRLSRVNAPAI
jgi:PPP family 3-phenylpropionic acid transporter